jgi:hypothetical protein
MQLSIKTQAISVHSMIIGSCRVVLLLLFCAGLFAQPSPDDFDDDNIEIVEGEDKTVYEYRQNGVLMMIKVVPKKGKTYYMVPAGGAHYEDLDHQKSLYPQWRIIEW